MVELEYAQISESDLTHGQGKEHFLTLREALKLQELGLGRVNLLCVVRGIEAMAVGSAVSLLTCHPVTSLINHSSSFSTLPLVIF